MSVLSLVIVLAVWGGVSGGSVASDTTLWFNQPATSFTTTLVVGNGRLGANHYGAVVNDRFGLNEDSIWSGSPYDPANNQSSQHLPHARDLVNAGLYQVAQDYLNDNCRGTPNDQTTYQTAGSLLLNFTAGISAVTNYTRKLDLTTSVTGVTYIQDNVTFTREAFMSHPADVLVIRLTASEPGRLSFNASFTTPMADPSTSVAGQTLVLTAGNYPGPPPVPAGLTYENRLQLITSGGSVVGVNSATNSYLSVSNATSATLFVAIATSYVRYDDISGNPTTKNIDTLKALSPNPVYDQLKTAHISEYQKYFNRVQVDFGQNATAAVLPTDVRAGLFQHIFDPGFLGRRASSKSPGYLERTSCSRLGQQIHDEYQSGNELRSWGAEVANLADLVEPLIRLIEDVAVTGARTAQVMYNASTTAVNTGGGPGNGAPWVLHHNTDQWRATAPMDAAFYGLWPTGAAFQLQTVFEHYLFDPTNTTFVQRIYPLFRGASQFFLETLQVHPNHTDWLVVNPSLSPEHGFGNINDENTSINLGVTMDNSLLRDLFRETATLANVLGVDDDLVAQLTSTGAKLPPFLVGAGGQLQEWLTDWDSEPAVFTHISPLYGLFPGNQISPLLNQTLSNAAETLLIFRGESTNGCASLKYSEAYSSNAASNRILLSNGIWPNLMGRNSVFQIDSTLGGLGTILETLLQSQGDEIHLLPALPAELLSGSFSGLRARGGLFVDATWNNGVLSSARITSNTHASTTITVRLANSTNTVALSVSGGQTKTLTASDFV
ncbi:glycosyl hydrolase family 65, N-terminal domain-containing protein [Mycena albidolilacea]|uniref:Glycosyl hydrolase family 65, N-terminal domain-containing protein n=1 Tax=Mycena albidolilacea TaxID=1033008 RepID=A0AAD6Z734_9AGAR|nr:glycosyl hydrolase family 65, N-terminal domain-containing protein [Mycena albidolilacea]